MALTGGLKEAKQEIPRSAHLYSGIQIITFLIATAMVIWYGVLGLRADDKKPPDSRPDPD